MREFIYHGTYTDSELKALWETDYVSPEEIDAEIASETPEQVRSILEAEAQGRS